MKQDAVAIEQALAVAVGEDAGLRHELQAIFLDSAARHALALATAASPAEWRDAALRLKGCAASFAAADLMAAATLAAGSPAGAPTALRSVAEAVAALDG